MADFQRSGQSPEVTTTHHHPLSPTPNCTLALHSMVNSHLRIVSTQSSRTFPIHGAQAKLPERRIGRPHTPSYVSSRTFNPCVMCRRCLPNIKGGRVVKKAARRASGAGRHSFNQRRGVRGYAVQRLHSRGLPEDFRRSAQPTVRLEAPRALRAVSQLLSNHGVAVLCFK